MEALARDKFVPMIMSSGASKVQMVRTGDLSFSVVTEYEDADKAEKSPVQDRRNPQPGDHRLAHDHGRCVLWCRLRQRLDKLTT